MRLFPYWIYTYREGEIVVVNAATTKIHYAFCLIIAALITLVYLQVFRGLIYDWSTNPDYSHGFIVPFIAAYMVWSRKDVLKKDVYDPSNWGLLILVVGLVQFISGYIGAEHFLQSTSLLFVLMGAVIFLAGFYVARIVLVPIVFLIFMIPLPAIIWNDFAFNLKLFATKVAVYFIDFLGMAVHRQGNVIYLPGNVLEVVDACSGLRSLISLLALGVLIAYFSPLRAWKRWVLIFSAIPIAILSNVIRLVATAFLTQKIGLQATEGMYHTLSGVFVFAIGVAMFLLVYWLLSFPKKRQVT